LLFLFHRTGQELCLLVDKLQELEYDINLQDKEQSETSVFGYLREEYPIHLMVYYHLGGILKSNINQIFHLVFDVRFRVNHQA